MSTSYSLKLNGAVGLTTDLTVDGIITFKSASYGSAGTGGNDLTNINLRDSDGNRPLHLSFRRAQNAIVFNTHTQKEGWGQEERIILEGKFLGHDTTVMVYDHGGLYQFLIDYRTVYYFNKRLHTNVRSISYGCNQGQKPLFSDVLQVITYTSMNVIMSQLDDNPGTPITDSISGSYTIAPHTSSSMRIQADTTTPDKQVTLGRVTKSPEQVWQLTCIDTGIAWIKLGSLDWYIKPSRDAQSVDSGTRLLAGQTSKDSRPIWKIAKEGHAYRLCSEFGNLCWTMCEGDREVNLQLMDKQNTWQLWDLIPVDRN